MEAEVLPIATPAATPSTASPKSPPVPEPLRPPEPKTTLLGMRVRHPVLQGVRLLALVMFGLVLPTVLLWSAHSAVSELKTAPINAAELREIVQALPAPVQAFQHGNDYSLLFGVFADIGEYRHMVNRMQMKTAVMRVGFAIACVGLLLMVLGVDSGAVEVGGGVKETMTLNMKAASGGIAVFVLGAAMAGAAGLMQMQHQAAKADFLLGPLHDSAKPLDPFLSSLQNLMTQCDALGPAVKPRCRVAALQAAEKAAAQGR
jgi:hypothetical protein